MNEVDEKFGFKKPLRYVAVYDEIYNRICHNYYSVGSQLPPENTLSKELGVSRMTLRQALKFLRDDGIIEIVQGKGSFVKSRVSKKQSFLDTFQDPVYLCLNEEPDEVEVNYHLQASTDYTNNVLKRDAGIVLFFDRWYKKDGVPVSYSFSTMPGDILNSVGLDIKNEDDIKDYLENRIYKDNKYSILNVQLSDVGNISSNKYVLSKNKMFYLMQEEIYSDGEFPILHTKHYLPVEKSSIQILTSKK